jgi:hypothetical protein
MCILPVHVCASLVAYAAVPGVRGAFNSDTRQLKSRRSVVNEQVGSYTSRSKTDVLPQIALYFHRRIASISALLCKPTKAAVASDY